VKKLKVSKNPPISVIVPIHIKPKKIESVRRSIISATTTLEVIYVIDKSLSNIITNLHNFEKIISVINKGRGFMLAEGARISSGEVIIFLHSDTILPDKWDLDILKSLENKSIIGGGFNLKFDTENTYLNFAIKLLTLWNKRSKILSGDRALFVRSSIIKKDISFLQIPIMEDFELSFLMKKTGNVVILDNNVITSADGFIKNGILRQTIKIFLCYFWYKIGGNLQDIYNFYYSKKKNSKKNAPLSVQVLL
jgi:glycosyltransferase involved in cell wall biosynthesis